MLTLCDRSFFYEILMRRVGSKLALGAILLTLAACGSVKTEAKYPLPQDSAEAKKYGTIGQIGDKDSEGGFTLFDSGKRKANAGATLGVNSYLWHAALDTINFMPILSADSNGGTILTDWYSPPATPSERVKLNIVIKDQTLRADGVTVRVFKQKLTQGQWRDSEVSPQTGTQLEDTIVARARQLRLQTTGKSTDDTK